MPCKKQPNNASSRGTGAPTLVKATAPYKVPKTKYTCIVEAHDSTKQRVEPGVQKNRENHIASKRCNSMTHYNLVHKFMPMPQVMKIPNAKAAVDKEWK